jgi:succinate dehydrogenase / fumarate reductase cytochrome b subunit
MAKRSSELGSLYKAGTGQWSWLAHRVTGVGILLFLFAHIIDTALVAWGPATYNKVISLYHHPVVQIMELGLVGAVIYHGLNGIRVMIMDFWPRSLLYHRRLTWTTLLLFGGAMVPITWIMGLRILEDLGWIS